MSKIRASGPRYIGSIPDMGKSFRPAHPRRPNRLWNHPMDNRGCFPMVKRSSFEPG